jgi:prepilin-type N-terminal cleavage/methylation domain-containing protein
LDCQEQTSLPGRRTAPDDGFTLVEMLVAVSILVIVVAIVYATLSSVVTATEQARVAAEEMRLRQFLARSFVTNFSTVYTDPGMADERYVFISKSEGGSGGNLDSVEFCSSAPIMGGLAPPGVLKLVRYAAASGGDAEYGMDGLSEDEQDAYESGPKLATKEALITEGASMDDLGQTQLSGFSNQGGAGADRAGIEGLDEMEGPEWSVPISSFDLAFFDGEEWQEEWDSIAMGRMPWCVRIRINYARTDEEKDADRSAGLSMDEDPDYEAIIPIPLGVGTITDATMWYSSLWPDSFLADDGTDGSRTDDSNVSGGSKPSNTTGTGTSLFSGRPSEMQ